MNLSHRDHSTWGLEKSGQKIFNRENTSRNMNSKKIDILEELYQIEPTLGSQILKNLNRESLVNCQLVSKKWSQIYDGYIKSTVSKKRAKINSIPGRNWFTIYLGYDQEPCGSESYGKDVRNLDVRNLVRPELSASQVEIMVEELREIRG